MSAAPIAFGPVLHPEQFDAIRTRMALDFCKWDCQVGDAFTLFRQPLLISPDTWRDLKAMAEAVDGELLLAEEELLECPDLHAFLGLPIQVRSGLREARGFKTAPGLVRAMRFDFHYTTDGWRVSEVNSDVPGGYAEASRFTELVSHCVPETRPPGDPSGELMNLVLSAIGEHGCIALLSAPGFLEDQQVTAFLASQAQERGLRPLLIHSPSQLSWKSGNAHAIVQGMQVRVDGIIRFYQGEWLAKLPSSCGWKWLLFEGRTPVTNVFASLLTESKRLPLACRHLKTKMPTWQLLLPESRDPREIPLNGCGSWIVKAAFSNTGDHVYIPDSMERGARRELVQRIQKRPDGWVAQRRFDPVPVPSDLGPLQVCLGVFTMNGRAAGIYARGTTKPVVDYSAMDIATLVYEESNAE